MASSQDWYRKEGTEYCKLFEQCEPKEIGRQLFIESIIEGQEPSFGYVVLANLIASGYIKPGDWYYLAGLESICGNADAALENLGRAVRSGMVDADWAMRDPDLELGSRSSTLYCGP